MFPDMECIYFLLSNPYYSSQPKGTSHNDLTSPCSVATSTRLPA